MVTTISALLLAASLALPMSFVAPKGWVAKAPPAEAPISFIWLSPKFGVNGNGENFSVTTHPASASTTLHAEVQGAIGELSQEREIVNSHAEPTCHGQQAGWTFEGRLTLPNGMVISQVYHLTIVGAQTYGFIFTHAAGDPIDPAIRKSIQSICPQRQVSFVTGCSTRNGSDDPEQFEHRVSVLRRHLSETPHRSLSFL
jgi:hypothetical protein